MSSCLIFFRTIHTFNIFFRLLPPFEWLWERLAIVPFSGGVHAVGMKRQRRCKCKHCHALYRKDPRAGHCQRYCGAPACRRASRRASQNRWLVRPENQDYFRGPDQVRRVQAWRKAHPGYWRKRPTALQDTITAQPATGKQDKGCLTERALQEESLTHPAFMVGLISSLAGSALQEDIVRTIRQLHHRGQTILNPKFGIETEGFDDAGKAFAVP
jgi:hypothetical protein